MFKFNLKTKKQKINLIFIAIFIILLSSFSIATFSRHKNRNPIDISSNWNGSIATSYRSGMGTNSDPYVISNASELAYFSKMLETTSYSNTYFILNNNIIINKGTFKYEDDVIKYILDGTCYYVNKYTLDYYSTSSFENKVGSINMIDSLNNFEGVFDGNSHTIYGNYITSNEEEYLGLFTNLSGTVKDLYVDNSLIYGGNITGGISSNAKDANILNSVYNGYVIGNSSNNYKVLSNDLDDINLSNDNNSISVSLNDINTLNYEIDNIILQGNINDLSSESTLYINNINITDNNFEINLDNLNDLVFVYSSSLDKDINITNLKIKIKYKLGISSGIIGVSSNTNITNSINKSYVYGEYISSGIIGFATNNINVKRSYNIGKINSNSISSGIISYLVNANSVISTCYNIGDLSSNLNSGILGIVKNTESLLIENTFNAYSDSDFIGNISDSSVNITKSYNISTKYINSGSYNGRIYYSTNLKNKSFLVNTLEFDCFTDLDNLSNNENSVWIYEDDSYPILYIDDIKNPLASININNYSWNNLSYELDSILLNDSVTFNISYDDSLSRVKEIYYYISNSKDVLSYEQINSIEDWILYDDVKKIEEEGFYIIYAKVIDYNDNVTYLNSDLIILDLTGCEISINYDNKEIKSFSDDLSTYFISDKLDVYVSANDSLSGVESISYYVSDSILSEKELNLLEDKVWNRYTNKITINNKKSVIYVKATDNSGIVSYANTDLILYEGYTLNDLYISGYENTSYDKLNVTNSSSIVLKYIYKSDYKFNDDETNYLSSNIILPKNTKISLNLNNNIYTYTVKENDYILKDSMYLYSFDLFKLVGKDSIELFKRSIKDDIDDIYKVKIDFKDANIEDNIYNFKLFVMVLDKDNNIVRSTLKDSLKDINLYANLLPTINISSSFNDEIMYNSTSTTNLDISLSKLYKNINNEKVIDSSIKNMVYGIKIKVLDCNGNIVNSKYLKNILFEIDNNKYSMNKDIININLYSYDDIVNKTLKIITSEDNSMLEEGNYYINITPYLSYDGVLDNEEYDSYLNILLNASNLKNNTNYSFDVISNNSSIINKNSNELNINYNIVYNGKLKNPKVYISLFKKSVLSAYDTSYSLVDIKSYISNDINSSNDNLYLLLDGKKYYNDNVMLQFNSNKLEYNLYKLRFYLYDNDKMIGFVDKVFITR